MHSPANLAAGRAICQLEGCEGAIQCAKVNTADWLRGECSALFSPLALYNTRIVPLGRPVCSNTPSWRASRQGQRSATELACKQRHRHQAPRTRAIG